MSFRIFRSRGSILDVPSIEHDPDPYGLWASSASALGVPAGAEELILGIPDEHVDHGAQSLWRHHYGLDAEGIAAAVRRRWPRLAAVAVREESAI